MPDTILKRWNGSAFEELYPKTTVGQISTSGTPSSSNFLRGDGQWQIPATQPHTHLSTDITDLKSNLKFLYIYGKAQSAITKGQAVQFAGVQGDHILMKPAVPSEINANPDYFIGLAESTLATDAFGYILTQGELTGLNTSGYTAGNILWFASAGSTAGAITATEPTNSNARIQVASVNRVNPGDGILFVRVNFVGTEIEDIVATGTPGSTTFLRGDGQWVAPSGSGTVTSVSSGTQISGMAMTITNGTSTPSIATSISSAANFRAAIGAGTGNGTVTSVAAGNGMSFTAVTGSGSVTMGTPSTLTTSTTNSVTSTSHTHAVTFPVTSVSSRTGAVDLSPSILGSTATVTSTGATVTVTTNQVVANGRYRFTYIIATASTNNASTPRGTFEIEMPPTLSTSHHIGINALGNFIPSNSNNDTSLYFRFAVRYASASSFFITGINGSRVNSSVLYNDTSTTFNLYITNIERIYY
jgi:hypothetical protein